MDQSNLILGAKTRMEQPTLRRLHPKTLLWKAMPTSAPASMLGNEALPAESSSWAPAPYTSACWDSHGLQWRGVCTYRLVHNNMIRMMLA